MTENTELLKQLRQIISEQNTKQTQEIKAQLNEELDGIKNLISNETEKITRLNKEIEELKSKNEKLERISKRNNIVIFNSNFKDGSVLNFTLALLNTHLELNLTEDHINDIYPVGKQGAKTIIVSFISQITKQKVLKNCAKLKGRTISISEELSREERSIRKVLVEHLKKARARNERAHIHGLKLYVEGKAYTFEDLTGQGTNTDEILEKEGTEEVERKTRTSQTGNTQEIDTKKNKTDIPFTRSSNRNNKK